MQSTQKVLNAEHIILYGKTEWDTSVTKVCALCLQTSALQSEPHQLSGELKTIDGSIQIVRMVCSCKAGAGGRCKHISAFLILLTRTSLSNLEHVSKTDLKCAWSSTRGSVKEKYKAIPTAEMPCIKDKKPSHKDLLPAESTSILEYFIENLPNSTIAKHRKGRTSSNVCISSDVLTSNSDKISLILDNACQSIIMMELSSMKCDLSVCCERMLQTIMNEDSEELMAMSQSSAEWHKARQFRITGSRCYEIFTYGGANWDMKSNKYFWPKSFSNKFTRHGLKFENEARISFMEIHAKQVIECGTFLFPNINGWGFHQMA